jgi:hypothetical protein
MTLEMGRCLGVIVVYDPLRAGAAVARFRALIEKAFKCYTLRIVTNNSLVDGDIVGSNRCGEFSGWTEGVSSGDYGNYDVIICANDTFDTRRPFSLDAEKSFIKKISIAKSHSDYFLVGELCWHINYQLFFARKRCVLKWVRTNMFAISTDAARKIGGISLPQKKIISMVGDGVNGDFLLSQDVPEVNRRRVEDWLNPVIPSFGWHGSQAATKRIKRLKAMCVLQELDLTKRCVEAGVPIYSSTSVRKRDYLLALLYDLQNRLL